MSNNTINRGLLFNVLWSFAGRFGYIFIGLITNIILVRLLSPKEFGQVSIIMFFIVIGSILIESGLSGALVRKEKTLEIDYSTVFIFNLIVSLILMISLVVSADYIAEFYDDSKLTKLLKLSSLVLVINALRITQYVKLIKDLNFKLISYCDIISITVGSIVAIYFAINGSGAISLVIMQLSTSVVMTVLLWFLVEPITSYKFSGKSFKYVYKFGVNTTFASILDKGFDNSYQLILAKYFAISESGYFYQAKKLQEVPVGLIQSSLLNVVYATLSKLQSNKKEFDILYFNVFRLLTVLIAFICLLIYFYAELIINILYGKEWMISAKYLQILIIASFFYILEIFNRMIFKIFDRTDIILKLEIFKKILMAISIVYGVSTNSINNLIYGFAVVSMISYLINYYFVRTVHIYSYWAEVKLISKVILSIILIIIISKYISNVLYLYDYYSLVLIPIMIVLYLIMVQFLKIINLKSDLNYLKIIINKL